MIINFRHHPQHQSIHLHHPYNPTMFHHDFLCFCSFEVLVWVRSLPLQPRDHQFDLLDIQWYIIYIAIYCSFWKHRMPINTQFQGNYFGFHLVFLVLLYYFGINWFPWNTLRNEAPANLHITISRKILLIW